MVKWRIVSRPIYTKLWFLKKIVRYYTDSTTLLFRSGERVSPRLRGSRRGSTGCEISSFEDSRLPRGRARKASSARVWCGQEELPEDIVSFLYKSLLKWSQYIRPRHVGGFVSNSVEWCLLKILSNIGRRCWLCLFFTFTLSDVGDFTTLSRLDCRKFSSV